MQIKKIKYFRSIYAKIGVLDMQSADILVALRKVIGG